MVRRFIVLSALATVGLASSAAAQTIFNTSVFPDWTVGTGQPNANFVVNNNTTEKVQLGLSSFYRFLGGQDFIIDNTYGFGPGPSPTSGSDPTPVPGLARWNFNFHVNLNTGGGTRDFTNTLVELTIDWDPTAGQTLRTYPISAPTSGVLVQGSQNLGFSFWQTLPSPPGAFNENALGIYEFTLVARDQTTNEQLSTVTMFVQIPTPGTAAVLALGGLLAARRRRA